MSKWQSDERKLMPKLLDTEYYVPHLNNLFFAVAIILYIFILLYNKCWIYHIEINVDQ